MRRASLAFVVAAGLCLAPGSLRAQQEGRMPSPEDDALSEFAARYTSAWNSGDPSRVASFFAPDGSLTVNGGDPAVGRAAITDVARGFMAAFPDMHLTLDGLLVRGGRAVYQWRFVGTNDGPGGTGQRVDFSGFEVWRFGVDGLVAESNGYFDAAEYAHQLEHGIGGT